jgi:hypothetical protein
VNFPKFEGLFISDLGRQKNIIFFEIMGRYTKKFEFNGCFSMQIIRWPDFVLLSLPNFETRPSLYFCPIFVDFLETM